VAVDNSLIDIVTQGFDAGIRYDDVLAQDMVVVPILADMRFVVVASPEYLECRTLAQHPQDLLQHECLNYRSAASGALPRWDFEKDGKHMRIALKGRLATNDSDLLLRAALDGFGFAYLSHASIAQHLDRGELVSVLEDWVPTSTLYLYYFERNNTPKKLRAFIDFLKAHALGV
jgi:DNA-binding transcriptional LysR family regulator